jgi:hypothetical protein
MRELGGEARSVVTRNSYVDRFLMLVGWCEGAMVAQRELMLKDVIQKWGRSNYPTQAK